MRGVYSEALAPASVSSAEGWRVLERVGACKERRGGACMRVCVCLCVSVYVCVQKTRLSAQPQAEGKSVLSAKVVVWLWKTERTEGKSVQRVEEEKEDICFFSLPSWVVGGRAWMVWSAPPWDAASVPRRSLRSNINYSMKSVRYCDQAWGRVFETHLHAFRFSFLYFWLFWQEPQSVFHGIYWLVEV